tara:strand:+ start:10200 stop:10439 length:240 start_codon:yes stop_codon:yes gene_type:complete
MGEFMDKVVFNLEPDAWHGHSTESLWATRLENGFYKVENSPFFVMGLAFEDIFETQIVDGMNFFLETSVRPVAQLIASY